MSFLKQLLTPFVEFDADKKKEEAKQNKPAPTRSSTAIPQSADEKAEHPLITKSDPVSNTPDQIPT